MYHNRHLTSCVVSSALAVGASFAIKLEEKRVPLIAVSGAFDPLHVGNLKCIQGAALLKGVDGLLVVIINSDEYCIKKKGYVFMPLDERMELVAAIAGVDFVVPWHDDSVNVAAALEIIKPNIFAKGGAHNKNNSIPEADICAAVGCTVVYGIGGNTKMQSSSKLVENLQKPKTRRVK